MKKKLGNIKKKFRNIKSTEEIHKDKDESYPK